MGKWLHVLFQSSCARLLDWRVLVQTIGQGKEACPWWCPRSLVMLGWDQLCSEICTSRNWRRFSEDSRLYFWCGKGSWPLAAMTVQNGQFLPWLSCLSIATGEFWLCVVELDLGLVGSKVLRCRGSLQKKNMWFVTENSVWKRLFLYDDKTNLINNILKSWQISQSLETYQHIFVNYLTTFFNIPLLIFFGRYFLLISDCDNDFVKSLSAERIKT